jgi:PAS domain S-box-containing protein
VAAIGGMSMDITERKQMEAALPQAQAELEQRVQERTLELTQANARLTQEIAERQRMETALLEERNLLRTLIDNLPDYIFIKDSQSYFQINNLAHLQLLGATSPQEITGKRDFDIFPPELAAQYYADEQQVIQTGVPLVNREEITQDRQGQTQWLLTTKVPFRNSQGEIVGLVWISRNITERKLIEEQIKKVL